MIQPNDLLFPNNIVSLLKIRSALIDSDVAVFGRPLRNSDPNQSIGITAAHWVPNEESQEMLGAPFSVQPPLSRYTVSVQAFVKDMDEERGLNTHAHLSNLVRSMLYADNPLRVALSSLSSTINGATETSKRWGVSAQRFFQNELGGEWLYLSNLEFWLETETR